MLIYIVYSCTTLAKPWNRKKSILKVLDGRGRKDQLVLFYGSQTGTAEDLATRLAKETSTNSDLPTLVCDLEDYDMEELFAWPTSDPERNYACGFFMATYGEGEPTDNAADFYSWIMDGSGVGEDDSVAEDQYTDSKPLGGLSYFIFGLGNSTYEHFNAIGKRLNKRMLGLGGVSLSELGSGDDDKRYSIVRFGGTKHLTRHNSAWRTTISLGSRKYSPRLHLTLELLQTWLKLSEPVLMSLSLTCIPQQMLLLMLSFMESTRLGNRVGGNCVKRLGKLRVTMLLHRICLTEK